MKKTTKLLTKFEKFWYTACALIMVWGLTYTVLGIIVNHSKSDSSLVKADAKYAEAMKLGFFGYGLILIGIATVLCLIVLLEKAKVADKEFEKSERRAARLAQVQETEISEEDK